MLKSQLTRLGAVALVAASAAPFRAPLQAQGTQPAQQTVQLAFGYECDDRFLVRNDGAQPVDIEYNVAGSADRSQLRLLGRQSVEISSPSNDALELRVGGKLVSTAHKANHPCAPAQPAVVVRPIDARDAPVQAQPAPQQEPQVVYQPQATLPAQVVYVEREPVYVAPAPYYYPYYYYPSPIFALSFPFFGSFGGRGRPIFVGRGVGPLHRR
ncbi:MAG: hypothetical protein ACHQQ3_06565 [Gemmatimonadales bacterium]